MIRLMKLLFVLFRIKLLTPASLFWLTTSIFNHGINFLALLSFAAKSYRHKHAVLDERRALSYEQLYDEALTACDYLREKYKLGRGSKVAVICKNRSELMTTIYAISGLGADLYLANTELSVEQLVAMIDEQQFDLIVVDQPLEDKLAAKLTRYRLFNCDHAIPTIIETDKHNDIKLEARTQTNPIAGMKHKRGSFGKLVLFTGGTTGKAKQAAHKPSLFNYLNPFYSFIMRLRINTISSAYIATPIFHGYGIAVMLLCHALGKRVVVTEQFQAKAACRLIKTEQIDMITVVPTMLQRLLKENSRALQSLRCIASGGAELSPRLANETLEELGKVLYNLYGTSEAGLNMIATPEDLLFNSRTIGRPVAGGKLKVLDEQQQEMEDGQIGQLCIKNSWSMLSRNQLWIETGDLAYKDKTGRFYLCGRTDSMIVSGGENVYPLEVEQLILSHQQVDDAAVIAVTDELYGQSLVAYVVCADADMLTEETLRDWLKLKLARFQMPKAITIVKQLPYTALGKKDRKQLQFQLDKVHEDTKR